MTSPLPHQSQPFFPPVSEKFNCGHYVKNFALLGEMIEGLIVNDVRTRAGARALKIRKTYEKE